MQNRATPKFQSTPPVKAATPEEIVEKLKAEFQSTPPVKAATQKHGTGGTYESISIHAAREGGDYGEKALDASCRNFNPRRP